MLDGCLAGVDDDGARTAIEEALAAYEAGQSVTDSRTVGCERNLTRAIVAREAGENVTAGELIALADACNATLGELFNSTSDLEDSAGALLDSGVPLELVVALIAGDAERTDVLASRVVSLGDGTVRLTHVAVVVHPSGCLLYTSPSPRDATLSRMPSSA